MSKVLWHRLTGFGFGVILAVGAPAAAFAKLEGQRTLANAPTAQQTLANALTGHRWEARSAGLAAEGLEAIFNDDGSFEGALQNPPDDMVIKPQRVTGRWHVAGDLLLLSYRYVDMAGPANAEFTIEITEGTADRLAGVDKLLRMWEFQRLE